MTLEEQLKNKTQELEKIRNVLDLKKASLNMATKNIIRDMIDYISKVVPKFSGTPSVTRVEELREYLVACEIYYNTLEKDDQLNYIKFLISLTLKEEASSLVRDQTINDFKTFRKILEDHYLPKRTLLSLCDELRQCTQKMGESIYDYGRRILDKKASCKEAINQLYPDEKVGFNKEYDTIALKTFKNGLKNEIMRQHAFLQEGKLEDLVKKLGEIEDKDSNQYDQRNFSGENLGVRPTAGNDNSNRQLYDNRQYRQGNVPQANITFKPQSNYRSNGNYNGQNRNIGGRFNTNNFNRSSQVICYSCGTPGHLSTECRKTNRISQVTCYSCGAPGHISTECRKTNRVSQLICYTCGKVGHTSRECRSKGQRVSNNSFPAKSGNFGNNHQEPRQNTQPQVRTTRVELCNFCQRAGHDVSNCHPKILWEQSQGDQSGNEGVPVVNTPTRY